VLSGKGPVNRLSYRQFFIAILNTDVTLYAGVGRELADALFTRRRPTRRTYQQARTPGFSLLNRTAAATPRYPSAADVSNVFKPANLE
jgi:hypothetical protein